MSRQKHLVIYDGNCAFCTLQMRLITRLDWFNVMQLVTINDPLATQVAPQINRETLLEALHCVATNGRIYRGARAIRFVSLRLPLLFLVALLLWIPGIILVAELLYQWVARNRQFLSRRLGCKDDCAILPERRRESDVHP